MRKNENKEITKYRGVRNWLRLYGLFSWLWSECLKKMSFPPAENWAMSSGFLSGKYQKTDVFTGDNVRRVIARFTPENMEANQPLLLMLQRFAKQKHAPPAQISLA